MSKRKAQLKRNMPQSRGTGGVVVTVGADTEIVTSPGMTELEHTAIGNSSPHHAPVTVAAGSDNKLTLDGQQVTLAPVVAQSIYDAHITAYNAHIANSAAHHEPVTAGGGIAVSDQQVSIDTSANLTWLGNHYFTGSVALKNNTTARHILPEATDTYDLGSSTVLWRKGWLSELDTVLFAENTMQVQGGWLVIGHGQGTLAADVDSADTTIDFGQAMTVGDMVVLRQSLQVEYLTVGTLVSDTTYNVTRDLDSSGANDWPQGAVFLVLGAEGDGRIELNANDSPRISLLTQGATYNEQTEMVRIGDLDGLADYSAETWGSVFGQTSDAAVSIDDTDGIRIWSDGSILGQWDTLGALRLGNDANEHVTIDSTNGIRLMNGATVYTHLDASGALTVGKTDSNHIQVDNTNGIQIKDNSTVLGQWDASGAISFGQTATAHVEIDTTNGVRIMNSTTTLGQWDTSGGLTLGDVGTDKANVYYNPSNDRLEFRGGANGETVQTYIDTDGAFVAGDGTHRFSSDGHRVYTPNGSEPRKGSNIFEYYAGEFGSSPSKVVTDYASQGYAGTGSTSVSRDLAVIASDYTWGSIKLQVTNDSNVCSFEIKADDGVGERWILVSADEIDISGADIQIDPGKYLGLGSSSARIEFNSGEIRLRGNASLAWQRDEAPYAYAHVANLYLHRDNTGTIKITLPNTWDSKMTQLRISGYQYGTSYGAWECLIGGYTYSGSGGIWYNTSAQIHGSAPFSRVRFGHDGSKCCILLGTTSTTWKYAPISVESIVTTGADYGTDWSISLLTSESGITVSTVASYGEPGTAFKTNRLRVGLTDSLPPNDGDAIITRSLAVGNLSTGFPTNSGDMNCANTIRAEGARLYLGTGSDYLGVHNGKLSHWDGSAWHDLY